MACPCLHKRWAVSTLTLTKSRDEEFVDESSHKNLAMLFQREAVTTKKCSCFWGLVVGWRDRFCEWMSTPAPKRVSPELRRMQILHNNMTHSLPAVLVAIVDKKQLPNLFLSWLTVSVGPPVIRCIMKGYIGGESLHFIGTYIFDTIIMIKITNH